MSLHAKWNHRLRPRVLGAATGVALLLGGGFAVQAVADSGVKSTPAAPKVTTTGDAAPQTVSKPVDSTPAGTPEVVEAGKPADAGKPGTVPVPAHAPQVIQPGSGVQK
ncbi:hypothetical protein [Streptomyces sp. BE133]|uniref:hypothetical protein n=1 Tax=Streptomyces sp. BE133 TaxID=3002523 RepID=UPI002E77542A|nr:hypothetical protein [Streptomyces sp. BE133]MEE1807470.1 hypothetical protein [Streptomyces sp. BE133]